MFGGTQSFNKQNLGKALQRAADRGEVELLEELTGKEALNVPKVNGKAYRRVKWLKPAPITTRSLLEDRLTTLDDELNAPDLTDERANAILDEMEAIQDELLGNIDITSADAVQRYQADLPEHLVGTTPEAVHNTKQLIKADEQAEEIFALEARLESELDVIKESIERSLNDLEKYPDVGRLPLNDNPVFKPTRPRDIDTTPIYTGLPYELNQHTWYHGTKVDNVDLSAIDPRRGGARGENGPAIYFTNQPDVAEDFAKATPNDNLPYRDDFVEVSEVGTVHEVKMNIRNPLDGNEVPTNRIRDIFIEAAQKTDVFDEIVDAYARKLRKNTTPQKALKLKDYWNAFGETIQDYREKEFFEDSPVLPERALLKWQREVNRGLIEQGYDAVATRIGAGGEFVLAALVPDVVRTTLAKTPVGTGDLVEQATARVNATSYIAEVFPDSITAKVDFREATVKAQKRIQEQLEEQLETVQAEATRLADHSAQVENKLRKQARTQQVDQRRANERKALADDAKVYNENTKEPDPCGAP